MRELNFINNVQNVITKERKRDYRQAMVIVLKEYFNLTPKQIGKTLGYADHTIYYHYRDKHEGFYKVDEMYRKVYDEVLLIAKETSPSPMNQIIELLNQKINDAQVL